MHMQIALRVGPLMVAPCAPGATILPAVQVATEDGPLVSRSSTLGLELVAP
jgi:hypothetical protein